MGGADCIVGVHAWAPSPLADPAQSHFYLRRVDSQHERSGLFSATENRRVHARLIYRFTARQSTCIIEKSAGTGTSWPLESDMALTTRVTFDIAAKTVDVEFVNDGVPLTAYQYSSGSVSIGALTASVQLPLPDFQNGVEAIDAFLTAIKRVTGEEVFSFYSPDYTQSMPLTRPAKSTSTRKSNGNVVIGYEVDDPPTFDYHAQWKVNSQIFDIDPRAASVIPLAEFWRWTRELHRFLWLVTGARQEP